MLGLPGIFNKREDPIVFPFWGGNALESDVIMSVFPDQSEVFHESSILLEHETGFIKNEKLNKIFEYWMYYTIHLKKLCLPFVVTNYNYKKNYIEHTRDGFKLTINLLIYNQEKITEC